MDAQTFLDNFGTIAEAPGGVDRVRELILNLALSGRLVPGDGLARAADEEPSHREGGGDGRTTTGENRLPIGWSAVSVSALGQLIRGVTYKKSDATAAPARGRIALLRANNIDGDTSYDDLVYVPVGVVKPEQRLRPGDFLICTSSGSKRLVGKTSPITEEREATFGAFCSVFRAKDQLRIPLLALWFKSPLYRAQISAASRGIGINNLRRHDLESLTVPMPPLAEQGRIVEMVDVLMSRCAHLEASLGRRALLQDSLAGALCSHVLESL